MNFKINKGHLNNKKIFIIVENNRCLIKNMIKLMKYKMLKK